MPRSKDAIFAQIRCSLLHGQRFNALSEKDQLRCIKLWLLAVRERTAVLKPDEYVPGYVANQLHIDYRTWLSTAARLAQKQFITIMPDGTIIIEDVMDYHKMLEWRKVHINAI